MTTIALRPIPIFKEVRALTLPWLACFACMVAPQVIDAPRVFGPTAMLAYFLGTTALGALSIGHEYTGRTLSLLLSLPARRERILTVKLGVLAAMLLTLCFVAYTLVFGDARLPQGVKHAASLLPLLCGLFLAPWLTMACRNPIGGAVFALAIPGVLVVAGELIGVRMYGHGSAMEAFRLTFASLGIIGLCAIGAVMGWWTFTRLEVIDGPGHDVRLPQWLRSASTRAAAPQLIRSNPLRLLVKKELRLQQMSLVLAAVYVLEWLGVVGLASVSIATFGYQFSVLTILHAGLLPMLVGSSASAGERQIGTLHCQILMPMAARKQWAVKVGVVFGLALVLGLGLPTVLLYLSGKFFPVTTPVSLEISTLTITLVFLLTSGSLYVSSLCASSLWGLVMSFPATVGAWTLLNVVAERVGTRVYFMTRIPTELVLFLVAGFIALQLRFALANHRSADRPATRVWTQVILLAAYVTVAVITLAVVPAFHR